MTVTVLFRCSGCDATAQGTKPLTREFRSLCGRDHGFGSFVTTTVDSVCPPGWWAWDPYTLATYCPACRSEIEQGAPCATAAPQTTDGHQPAGSYQDDGAADLSTEEIDE